MKDFPQFMKNPQNRIKQSSQYTNDIEGYVYEGADGAQIAYWTCSQDRISDEHMHDYDEYVVCVYGQYTVIINGEEFILNPGNELFIAKNIYHGGKAIKGTRTILAFVGKRAERENC
jgi:quercetin dioxygenase-like cupin family protein